MISVVRYFCLCSNITNKFKSIVSSNPTRAQQYVLAELEHLGSELHRNTSSTTAIADSTRYSIDITPPLGFYLHGSPGSGKTAMMNAFYESISFPNKFKTHFHTFMLDIHNRLHRYRQETKNADIRKDSTEKVDQFDVITKQLVTEKGTLWCLDEFQVTDIADAMILQRLLQSFFKHGCTFIFTTNRSPDTLYYGGLNRSLFLPCIYLIKQRCQVISLDGEKDFRRLRGAMVDIYIYPIHSGTTTRMNEIFRRLCEVEMSSQLDITIKYDMYIPSQHNRKLCVPVSCGGVAFFSFEQLCGRYLGSADYISLAKSYHTLILDGIALHDNSDYRNKSRRLIILLDILYENHIRLICSADSSPDELFALPYHQSIQNPTARLYGSKADPNLYVENSIVNVVGRGGSSGRSHTVIERGGGGNQVEWSATGLTNVSLVDIEPEFLENEIFDTGRAVSRLIEMASDQYLQEWTVKFGKQLS